MPLTRITNATLLWLILLRCSDYCQWSIFFGRAESWQLHLMQCFKRENKEKVEWHRDRKVWRIRGHERTVSWVNHKQKQEVFPLNQIQFLRHSDTLMTVKLWLKCTTNTSCDTEIDSSPSCAHCDPRHSICPSAAVRYGSCHFRFGSKAPLVSGSPGNFHVFEFKKKLWQHQSKFMRLMGDIARMGGALLCSGMARITWRSR